MSILGRAPYQLAPVLDTFDRADGAIGANWTQAFTGSGVSLEIASNQAGATSAGATQYGGAYWNASGELFNAVEMYGQIPVLPDGTNEVVFHWHSKNQARNGAPASSVSTASGYFLSVKTGTWEVLRYDGTTAVSISGAPVVRTQTAGDWFRIVQVGSQIKVFVKPAAGEWSLLATYTDATYTSGWLGFEMQGFTSRIDNFGGGRVTNGAWGFGSTGSSAAVAPNRLSRDTRIGRVAVANSPDGDAHRGFGAFPPLVVGEAKRYFGPKTVKPYARNAVQQRWTQRKPRSFYTKAVVIGGGIAFGGASVKLTPPRATNPPTRYRLRPPTVVDEAVAVAIFGGPRIKLTAPRSTNPVLRYRLSPPTVVTPEATEIFFGPDTKLAPSTRARPMFRLSGPVVINGAIVHAPVTVTLAYSRRGAPKSRLAPPAVVARAPVKTTLTIHLAYSRRGVPKSLLAPPAVAPLIPPVETTLQVNLAYSRRGKPLSGLGRPVVLDVNRDYPQGPMVSLAPSRRGKPKSKLRAPVVAGEFVRVVYAPLRVKLAPSTRLGRRPRSFYSGPAVLADTRALGGTAIWLVQPPRRARVTHSRLTAPPVARAAAPLQPLAVTLAPSRRRRGMWLLRRPTVVFPVFRARATDTSLARIRPPRVHSLLKPPTVVHTAVELLGPEVTLAPQSRRPGNWFLRPMGGPAVVYAPLSVNLTYSRRGRPVYRLTLTEVSIPICFGTVTGIDFGSTVCGDDEGLTVAGVETAASTTGSDSGASVEGATAPGGSVTGGDARREGC